jgi:phytoene synthase
MDTYTKLSYDFSRQLTKHYSTSFSLASRLFSSSIRPHIYNIYGLVRIADEIVDTYTGPDQASRLQALALETAAAMQTGYSPNPFVHAFVSTARRYGIDARLIDPFFTSMALDIQPSTYRAANDYNRYIYGSAAVIGCMCLKVFSNGDTTLYEQLRPAAEALGRAFQKVNFLRDLVDDHDRLHRYYFPVDDFDSFDDDTKANLVGDIRADFLAGNMAIHALPIGARKAVQAASVYYEALLQRLAVTPVEVLKHSRVRVPDSYKLRLFLKISLGGR